MTTYQLRLSIISIVTIIICAGVLLLAMPLVAVAAEQTFQITASERGFSPSTISVNEGDTVTLVISTADVKRNFVLSEFGVSETIKVSGASTVSFTADSAGTFTFSCTTCEEADQSGSFIVQAAEIEEEEEISEPITISGATVSEIGASTALVTWTTDQACYGQVEYGTASGTYIAATPLEEKASSSHTAYLTGLQDNATYFYRIKIQDESQTISRGSEATFATEEIEGEDAEDDEEDEDSTDDEGEDAEDADSTDVTDESDSANETVYIATISSSTETHKLTGEVPKSKDIKFEVGEQLTITGYASPEADVTIEFCCAVTRYSATADSTGYWTFQGSPMLLSGEQYVRVTEKDSGDKSKKLKFTVKGDEELAVADEEEVGSNPGLIGSINWVVALIIGGILLIIFSGVMFVRQMRR